VKRKKIGEVHRGNGKKKKKKKKAWRVRKTKEKSDKVKPAKKSGG